jgi:hypothetical protein
VAQQRPHHILGIQVRYDDEKVPLGHPRIPEA